MNNYKVLEQFRCPKCNKLIVAFHLEGKLTITAKCSRCSRFSTLIVERENK